METLYAVITTLALLLISLTMLLRCHEYNETGGRAFVRKIGLLTSGVSPVGLILAIWFGWNMALYLCTFCVGLFMVFFTTSNGVPWEKWIWHGLQEVEKELEDEIHKRKP